MKLISVLINIFLFISTVCAQTYFNFPDSNATWTEMESVPVDVLGGSKKIFHCYGLLNKDTILQYKEYFLNGTVADSVVYSNKYHKLYYSANSIFTEDEYIGGIREDSLKIYYYGKDFTKEFKIYDFSFKNIGDTIRNIYNLFSNYNGDLILTNIDSVNINGKNRRRIWFYDNELVQWIEGIGNIRGLLWTSYGWPNNGTWNDLICYIQNDTMLYHYSEYSSCFINPQDLHITEIIPKIEIYPNPVENISYIKLNETENDYHRFEVYNLMGNLIKTLFVRGISNIPIYKNEYPSGIYFFKLTDSKGISISGNFIII